MQSIITIARNKQKPLPVYGNMKRFPAYSIKIYDIRFLPFVRLRAMHTASKAVYFYSAEMMMRWCIYFEIIFVSSLVFWNWNEWCSDVSVIDLSWWCDDILLEPSTPTKTHKLKVKKKKTSQQTKQIASDKGKLYSFALAKLFISTKDLSLLHFNLSSYFSPFLLSSFEILCHSLQCMAFSSSLSLLLQPFCSLSLFPFRSFFFCNFSSSLTFLIHSCHLSWNNFLHSPWYQTLYCCVECTCALHLIVVQLGSIEIVYVWVNLSICLTLWCPA